MPGNLISIVFKKRSPDNFRETDGKIHTVIKKSIVDGLRCIGRVGNKVFLDVLRNYFKS